jgi:signal transduction histidine kinase/DNA-binding response OmpR family regulator
VLCLLFAVQTFAQTPIIKISGNQNRYAIGKVVEVLEDSVFNWTIDSVLLQTFQKSTQLSHNYGVSKSDYWFRFKVQNTTPKEETRWIFQTEYQHIDLVTFYEVKGNQDSSYEILAKMSGNNLHPNYQEISDATILFYLNVQDTAVHTYYVHFQVRNSKHFPMYILEVNHYFNHARQTDLLFGLYFGFLIIMIIYHLLLYFSSRDITFLYYVGFLMSFLLIEVARTGYGRLYLWQEAVWFNQHCIPLFIGLTIFFGTIFFTKGLNVAQSYPKLNRLMYVYWALCAILVIYTWSVDMIAQNELALLVSFLGNIYLLTLGILSWLQLKYRPAKFYVFALLALFAGIVVSLGLNFGLISNGFLTDNSLQIGAVSEIMLLSYGLGIQIRLDRTEKQNAQNQLIITFKENEKIQLETNFELNNQNVALEKAYQALIESNELTDKLKAIDEAKTRFFTNVTHEFRSPLTLILTPLKTLLNAKNITEQQQFTFQIMQRNANNLLALINQLLDLSKIETGMMTTELSETNLIDFCQTSVANFTDFADLKKIILKFTATHQTAITEIDNEKLSKVLNNLLSNALKFSNENQTVHCDLVFNKNQVIITVSDEGIGISKEEITKIFDRFYQGKASSNQTQPGSGIGLSLTKELIKLMNGTIEVQSIENQGSTFKVILPLTNLKLDDSEPLTIIFSENQLLENVSVLPKINATQKIILLIEDNRDLRALLRQALIEKYQILEAENGEQGIEIAQKFLPDLIISDWMMPKMTGEMVCKTLKNNVKTSHIPIILLTAKVSNETRLTSYEIGADDYITKPFDVEILQSRINNLLTQRLRLRDYYRKDVSLLSDKEKLPTLDEQFLEKAHNYIEKNLLNAKFSIETLAAEMNMSRSQLHRKLAAIAGQSTSEFIRNVRLRKAAFLLSNQQGGVSEVAFEVGFDNLSYFTRSFKEVYNCTPSEFLRNAN